MSWVSKYISKSKKGLNRNRNQDRILILDDKELKLFMLFDGVSSNPESYKFIQNYMAKIRKLYSEGGINEKNIQDTLYQAHKSVLNSKINGQSTMSAVLIKEDSVYFVNIGDSRIYNFSNQFIEKITKDDSSEYNKYLLTNYLGNNNISYDDFSPKKLEDAYNLLICSDGFYELMEDNLKDYFFTINRKYLGNIEKKLADLQRRKNVDDSSYILLKNEISE